ncbi:hypothetical protein WJM97_11230 [Okeanomitos corallinicola TIOX110]|uniref:PEP-CTERM sorting domain-containing protein n=1 Tax=Okeanomitos corallinicola TIOX110 TaxID=3133117 RepID=A0ABZ2UPB0_9CYAN
MKYKFKPDFKKLATAVIALSGFLTVGSMTLSAESAQALEFSPAPADFTVSGLAGSNNASPSIPVNIQAPQNGFGNVFNSNFILLGANTGSTSIIAPGLSNGNSIASSPVFTLTPFAVANPITLTFNWAFNGNASGTGSNADNFNILLVKTDESVEELFFSRTAGNAVGRYGFGNVETGVIGSGLLTPGQYQIIINLNENAGSANSAAGFNNIVLSGPPEPVPFGFSTNASLVVFGGVFYGFHQFRKKHSFKKAS